MNLNTISTKQLRENFDQVLVAMVNNQPLTLLYRSKPLAEINQWLNADRLTKKQQQKINALINRLP